MEIRPGLRIDNLVVEELLGAGAFAEVWRAWDPGFERRVALKAFHAHVLSDLGVDREHLRREARIVGGIANPHVVTLYRDHEPEPGAYMLEMEYVDGGTLEQRLVAGAMSREETLRVLGGVLEGLDAAHRQGVSHGDVKPENVLLGREGEVKITDFGLGMRLGDASLMRSTGGIRGTPLYMAPEVLRAERHAVASDLWAVGVVLYRMITHAFPFAAEDVQALFYAVQHVEPRLPPPGVPTELVTLAMRCLSKQPEGRPASCREILDWLGSLGALGAPVLRPGPAGDEVRTSSPLLDRRAEMGRLEDVAASVAGGQGRVALVTGEGGIGKSRLLEELRLRTEARGFRWLLARVAPVGGLWPALLEAGRAAVGDDGASGRVPLTTARFGPAAGGWERLLRAETPKPDDDARQLPWLFEQLAMGLARDRPLGLIVEDVRNAEAEDFQLLKAVASRLAESPVLIVVALRTYDADDPERQARIDGAVASLATLPHVVRLELGPLPREAVLDLLQREAKGRAIAAEVVDRVLERSGGNPLYALELERHLCATGEVEVTEDRVGPGPGWGRGDLPPRLEDVVRRRLAALSADERSTLEAAAVDGLRFDGEALAAVLEEDLLRVLRTLQRLYRPHGIVVPLPRGYRFAQSLFQEVIYGDIGADLRRAMHRRLAAHLASRADGASVDPERMGLHWERAGEPGEAAPYLARAAQGAASRQQYLRALDLARRAGLHPGPIGDAEAQGEAGLLFALAGSLSDLGRHDEARALVDRVGAAARALADRALEDRATVWGYDLELHARGSREIDCARLVTAARRLPAGSDRVRGLYVASRCALFRGDNPAARALLEEAREICDALGLGALAATVRHALGQVAEEEGHDEEAEQLYGESIGMSEASGKTVNAAVSRVFQAVLRMGRRVDADLLSSLERAVHTLALSGSAQLAAHAGLYLARAHYGGGDIGAAERRVAKTLRVLGDEVGASSRFEALELSTLLATVRGDLDRARETLVAARAAAEAAGAEDFLVDLSLSEMRIRAFLGDDAGAHGAAEDALRRAATFGAGVAARVAPQIAEAYLFGLPAAALDDAERCLARLGDAPALAPARTVVDGARAFACVDGDVERLRAGARALVRPSKDYRRAELDLLATWWTLEARRREQGVLANDLELGDATERARRLGHVWIEAALARLADVVAATPRKVPLPIERVASALASSNEQDSLLAAWRVGRGARPFAVAGA